MVNHINYLMNNSFFYETDWKVRFDSIKTLTETAQKYSESLVKHKLANNFIDIFIKLITDPNTKVSFQALTGFNSILDEIKVICK